MFNIGPAELIIIFLVALLVVGPKRLPEIGRTLGRAMREFRKATDDFKQHLDFDTFDDDDLPEEHGNGHGNGKDAAASSPSQDDSEHQP